MDAQKHGALLIALLIGAGVAVSGCNRPNSPDTAGRTADKYASSTPSSSSSTTSSTMAPSTPPNTASPSSMASGTTSTTDTTSSSTGQATDDTAITTKVKAAILAEPGLHSMDIGVDTKDGIVTLSGTVDSPPLKERAKQVVSNVSGVRSVVDNLTAKSA